ncbi:hypothetical protein GCM10022202_20770 [Microbacterium marinilacus]|uniref:Uncharacterized protein n=1 Tax=Microbacterium marinilacus TaxID=415209 RepID=A0ABP7BG47_9MICO
MHDRCAPVAQHETRSGERGVLHRVPSADLGADIGAAGKDRLASGRLRFPRIDRNQESWTVSTDYQTPEWVPAISATKAPGVVPITRRKASMKVLGCR